MREDRTISQCDRSGCNCRIDEPWTMDVPKGWTKIYAGRDLMLCPKCTAEIAKILPIDSGGPRL